MRLSLGIIWIGILATLISCSNNKTKDETKQLIIEERHDFPATKSEKLFTLLRPQTQIFQVNADSDNSIKCKNGTLVFIPKNSFIGLDGSLIKGKVDISVIEVLSVSDFIMANLQTVCNGRILQSEGMVYIDVRANAQSIALADGKKLQIELPKADRSAMPADTRIFSGTYDSSGHIN